MLQGEADKLRDAKKTLRTMQKYSMCFTARLLLDDVLRKIDEALNYQDDETCSGCTDDD